MPCCPAVALFVWWRVESPRPGSGLPALNMWWPTWRLERVPISLKVDTVIHAAAETAGAGLASAEFAGCDGTHDSWRGCRRVSSISVHVSSLAVLAQGTGQPIPIIIPWNRTARVRPLCLG